MIVWQRKRIPLYFNLLLAVERAGGDDADQAIDVLAERFAEFQQTIAFLRLGVDFLSVLATEGSHGYGKPNEAFKLLADQLRKSGD